MNLLLQTNTFQMVLATDEVFTYAIFNYASIRWTSHTEAGGDTTTGEGGTPAYVSNKCFLYLFTLIVFNTYCDPGEMSQYFSS